MLAIFGKKKFGVFMFAARKISSCILSGLVWFLLIIIIIYSRARTVVRSRAQDMSQFFSAHRLPAMKGLTLGLALRVNRSWNHDTPCWPCLTRSQPKITNIVSKSSQAKKSVMAHTDPRLPAHQDPISRSSRFQKNLGVEFLLHRVVFIRNLTGKIYMQH